MQLQGFTTIKILKSDKTIFLTQFDSFDGKDNSIAFPESLAKELAAMIVAAAEKHGNIGTTENEED